MPTQALPSEPVAFTREEWAACYQIASAAGHREGQLWHDLAAKIAQVSGATVAPPRSVAGPKPPNRDRWTVTAERQSADYWKVSAVLAGETVTLSLTHPRRQINLPWSLAELEALARHRADYLESAPVLHDLTRAVDQRLGFHLDPDATTARLASDAAYVLRDVVGAALTGAATPNRRQKRAQAA